LTSCSYWAEQYTGSLRRILGKGIETTLFICRKGTASFYIEENTFHEFGTHLSRMVTTDQSTVPRLLGRLHQNTDDIMAVMHNLTSHIPTYEEYKTFLTVFDRHLAYHNFIKKTVEFLPPDFLQTVITQFTEARIYSESVYSETEKFFRHLALTIATKERRDPESLTCLLSSELEVYLQQYILPPERTLAERYTASALLSDNRHTMIFTGQGVDVLENCVQKLTESGRVTGTTAFPGFVKGICRVIVDPHAHSQFDEGNILVTGMTRPEFFPYMKKAAAIVTDVGGVLSHAAITAREMKKPCIIGTGNATKTFRTGDNIIVNAHTGEVSLTQHGK